MPICKLCHQREADKTGSHIVPFFLMRTVDNVDNKKERGMELGFELGQGYVKGYFGGGVLPERLEPVFGEISDTDIAASRSNMIVDYLLCTSCENRLGKIEGFYATTLAKKSKENYQSTDDSFHALMFWISVFWRLTVSDNIAYHLSENDVLRLRIILDGGLDVKDIPNYINRLGKEISDIRYRIIRCPGYIITNPGWLFLSSDNTKPYCLLVGEFAIFLYIGDMDTETVTQSFLGLENESLKCKLNGSIYGEYILPVSIELFADACRQTVDFWKDDFLKNIDEVCEQLHQKFIKKGSMPPEIKQQIVEEISAEGKIIGRQYSVEGVVDAITKTLMKFELYRSIAERL